MQNWAPKMSVGVSIYNFYIRAIICPYEPPTRKGDTVSKAVLPPLVTLADFASEQGIVFRCRHESLCDFLQTQVIYRQDNRVTGKYINTQATRGEAEFLTSSQEDRTFEGIPGTAYPRFSRSFLNNYFTREKSGLVYLSNGTSINTYLLLFAVYQLIKQKYPERVHL